MSIREYARGVAGGLLFSLPLLYTMEMWSAGFLATPARLLTGLAATFVLLLGYNRYAGLRHETTFAEIAIDSVEELGMGLVGAAAILLLLGQVTLDMAPGEALGRIVVQGLVCAIGVSIGTAQLGAGSDDQGAGTRREQEPWSHVILSFCGAVLLAANVAPTEEIQILGAELSTWHLAGLMAMSLSVTAVVLHLSAFRGSQPPEQSTRLGVIRSTVITYAIALATSAALLWFFRRFDGSGAGYAASQTVVLGVVSSLGASAGRLLLVSVR